MSSLSSKLKNLKDLLAKECINIIDKIEISNIDIIDYLKEFNFSINSFSSILSSKS